MGPSICTSSAALGALSSLNADVANVSTTPSLPHTIVHGRSGYSHFVLTVVLKNIFISNTNKYETSAQKNE